MEDFVPPTLSNMFSPLQALPTPAASQMRSIVRACLCTLVVLALVEFSIGARGDEKPPVAAAGPDCSLSVSAFRSAPRLDKPPPDKVVVGVGDKIYVELKGLAKALKNASCKIEPSAYFLFLDGYPIQSSNGVDENPDDDLLRFTLERASGDSRKSWVALLGSPTGSSRQVNVSVGRDPKGSPLPIEPGSDAGRQQVELRIFDANALLIGAVCVLAALVLFGWLARRSGMLRDPIPRPVKERPYSLARFQMAWWLFLVVGSFLFIWLITQDHAGILDPSVLALMGIATGTVLGAAVVDASKTGHRRRRPRRSRRNSIASPSWSTSCPRRPTR